MKSEYCDLHIHTIHSDGECNVQEIFEKAKSIGLKQLSITDHDCVDAYFDDAKFDGELIVGCEFVANVGDNPIEILGYGLNLEKAKAYLSKFGIEQGKIDEFRCSKILQMIEKLNLSIDFKMEDYDFKKSISQILKIIFSKMLENKQLVDIMNEENALLTSHYSKFLRLGLNNPNSRFYASTKGFYPDYEFIIDKIHSFGGLAFLAHPFQYGNFTDEIIETVASKIDGLECYHFTVDDAEKQNYLFEKCKKHNLMKSGGSDYHFKYDPNHFKDRIGEFNVPKQLFDEIKNLTSKIYA